ncbi:efflux RND transporter periplasmic adaptor subunit [Halomonas sp. V046]|uniref:efflux RND transporter periplasmic adaptor subunit n=1 Tax=Halomonas sp. V046 TaxID=3459611 RepID=UPI00404493F6
MSLRRFSPFLPLLLAASTALLSGCSDPEPPLTKQLVRPVKLLTLSDSRTATLARYPGVVEASERSNLAFRVGGELATLDVQAGQKVEAGQRIASIDQSDARNALANAQSSYDLALATYRRMQASVEKGAISRAAFDESRAAFLSAQAQFEQAKDQLGYTELTAPFDGIIASVPVDNFQVVTAQETIAVLQQPGNIDVTFDLPEQQVRRLDQARTQESLDTQATVAWVSFGSTDQRYPANYKEHDSQARSGSLSYTVTLTLATPDDVNVLAGMSAVVELDLERLTTTSDDLWRLPLGTVVALESAPESSVVWRFVADEGALGHVESVPVEIRTTSDEGVFVAADLAPGDRLVSAGASLMIEGQSVTPWQQEEGL